MKNNIIPAILESEYSEIELKINLIKNFADRVELDICDGEFVAVKTWPFIDNKNFENLRKQIVGLPAWQKIDYTAHLMVQDPGFIIGDLISAGFSRIFIHLEIGHDKCFGLIDEWGKSVEIGLAVQLETDLSEVVGFFKKVSFIQLLGRGHLGAQGYDLDQKIFSRIKKLQELGFNGKIIIDGGVNLNNFTDLIDAGASGLVVGSAIFESDDPVGTLKILQRGL